ncbi:C39 family peptidase [Streptomyces sp. NBC_00158]|uniref:C39 family peptidase n=1 Tax=Streptomyces sp. NBC_00158 TaxID=2903627 RepID=UPI002F914515
MPDLTPAPAPMADPRAAAVPVAPLRPVRHEVPYFAQWESPELVSEFVTGRLDAVDDPRWRASGADSPEEYAFWSWRVCGMACLRMALAHWGLEAPPSVTLGKEYLEAGAYVPKDGGLHGLIYEPFARHTRDRFGLRAESRPELPLEEIAGQLHAGRLVMLSVHPGVRSGDTEPPHRGGHLVLAVGADRDAVTIHNPSGWHGTSQEFAVVPWPVMHRYYAGRGVLLGRPPAA